MDHDGKSWTDVSEVIDGNKYTNCRFERCTMVYKGGELPHMSHCHFESCSWQFAGAAERTLVFMRHMYQGMGQGGKDLIEETVRQLQQPLAQINEPMPPSGKTI